MRLLSMGCDMSLGRYVQWIDPSILLPVVAVVLLIPEMRPVRGRWVTSAIGAQIVSRHWTFDPQYVEVHATNGWPVGRSFYGVWPVNAGAWHNVYTVKDF